MANWFYHIFSSRPLIAYVKQPWHHPELLDTDRPLSALVGFLTNREDQHNQCLGWVRDRSRRHKNHYYEILCDTEELTEWFLNNGVRASLVNENAFHDENEFSVRKVAKDFPLIYVAAADPYKNLWLLKGLEHECLWVCGRIADQDFYERVCDYPKVVKPSQFRVERTEVCRYMNRSSVGLCLSRQEASMRAACEYALCGLPVVNLQTTGGEYSPSSCGREVLLDPRFTVTFHEAGHKALNAAVAKALAMRADPNEVRAAYLERRKPHRERFVEALNRCSGHLGMGEAFDDRNSFQIHCNFVWQPMGPLLQAQN